MHHGQHHRTHFNKRHKLFFIPLKSHQFAPKLYSYYAASAWKDVNRLIIFIALLTTTKLFANKIIFLTFESRWIGALALHPPTTSVTALDASLACQAATLNAQTPPLESLKYFHRLSWSLNNRHYGPWLHITVHTANNGKQLSQHENKFNYYITIRSHPTHPN